MIKFRSALLLVAIASITGACTDRPRKPVNQLPPAAVALRSQSAPVPESSAAQVMQIQQEGPVATGHQIFPGSGRVIGGISGGRQEAHAQGDITLNFVNTDIKEVLRTVFGEILQANFSVDPKVQGTITLQTNRPVSREAVLPILEGALRVNGLGIVRSGDIYTIAPTSDLMRLGPGIGRGNIAVADQPGYGLRVVPLSHVSSEEIATLLKSLMPQDAVIRTIPSRNVLLLGGTQAEISTMLETVSVLDVNWFAGMSFGLFSPRNVDAKTIVKELEVIFGLTVKQSGASPIRIVPVERVNAVLAIAHTTATLREIEAWVDRLDRGAENVDERIYVYYVQNGRAADLANSLNSLFGESADSNSSVRPARRAEDGSGRIPGAIVDFRVPGSEGRLGTAAPTPDGALARTEVAGVESGIRVSGTAGLRLKADEVNNALLIMATPREYRIIEAALSKLDIPPLQVMIEAVVAEVTLTDELRYGVQWLFQPGSQSFTLSQASSGAVNGLFPGFSAVLAKGNDIRFVLSALESITNVNVVSSPKLMVLNNQTATLQVGDQVPIATQSAVSVGAAGAPVVNTIQFRDTGVILKVTPRVNESGLVLMDINQEVSDVTRTTTSNLDSPTIQQRKVASSISVTTGETIALGGLIRDRRTNGDSGIPVLKDVPVFGNLFKSTSEATTRTELLVLITPQVVRAPADIRRVTQELRDRLRIPPGMLGEQ